MGRPLLKNRLAEKAAQIAMIAGAAFGLSAALPQSADAGERLREAETLYRNGHYFKSARYAFAAAEEDSGRKADAYSWITISLLRSGLHHSATYFFIRTLQMQDKQAIRRVLPHTQELLVHVGADLFRKYLIRHTEYADYDVLNRSAYLYSLGKDVLLKGDEKRAIGYFSGMSDDSSLWPFALQLRASAYAIAGNLKAALKDYRDCQEEAGEYASRARSSDPKLRALRRQEGEDLQARCTAGEARVLYEQGKFAEADKTYDRIPKSSFVWTDILFEQAWNAYGRKQYNRALGKLVSYKSPALSFVFNSEVDVLRAQSYLALCLYGDANEVINEFNAKYAKVGQLVKSFVERKSRDLNSFYKLGKEALEAPLHTTNDAHRMMNRFVRGPYFQNLVQQERSITPELAVMRRFAAMQPGVPVDFGRGFPGFLEQVLNWRIQAVRLLGGAFVKNSLMDYHSTLIADFEKMSFIKLEMLSRAKDKLLFNKNRLSERLRGNEEPSRRDDQYRWGFNGEFWNDELGDYVFGLESECRS